jgi:hypothetical protein
VRDYILFIMLQPYLSRGNLINAVLGNSVDTPWKAVVGGVEFQRSRNGNLVRAGLVRASRSVLRIRISIPKTLSDCRLSKLVHQKSTELCKFYTIHGIDCLPRLHIWTIITCGRLIYAAAGS